MTLGVQLHMMLMNQAGIIHGNLHAFGQGRVRKYLHEVQRTERVGMIQLNWHEKRTRYYAKVLVMRENKIAFLPRENK